MHTPAPNPNLFASESIPIQHASSFREISCTKAVGKQHQRLEKQIERIS
jgi:hypothetical protein